MSKPSILFELLYELEKTFDINIDFDEIDHILKNSKALTIKDLADYVKEQQFLE